MRVIIGLSIAALIAGCANFDGEAFQRNLTQAYAFNQATTQRQVDALNAQSQAMALQNASYVRTQVSDFDWDWDQFYNQYGQLVWACRGVQTAQFVEPARCAFKAQTDLRWPSK